MRVACIKSYNKVYDSNAKLKEKQKGRNFDINVKDMDSYKKFADNYDKHNQKLKLANDKTNKVYTSSNEVKEILDKENMMEEIADVLICIEILKQIYDIPDHFIEDWIKRKQERMLRRMEV